MSKIFMVTMPRDKRQFGLKLWRYIHSNDIHKWVMAMERGRGGYEHWQCRLEAREDFYGFQKVTLPIMLPNGQQIGSDTKTIKTGWLAENIPEAHCEEASDVWDYERKEGHYFTSNDRKKNWSQRFGKYRPTQKYVLDTLDGTNDREIVVWYNPSGGVGKSWLLGALWERGLAYKTHGSNANAIVQDIANAYYNHGWRPYVIIDLPRNCKWTDDLYIAVEMIKDGLIGDPRYGSKTVNVECKVMVMTNDKPNIKKLSADRWIIIEDDGKAQTKIAGLLS